MTVQPIEHHIHFTLTEESTLVNETVKITVHVNVLAVDKDETSVRAEIRGALEKFIPGTEWQFSNQRRGDDNGYERVTLNAVARVKETENYSLEQRLEAVSKMGMKLQLQGVDDTMPQRAIQDEEQALRLRILTKALEEADKVVALTRRDYRLGQVQFGQNQQFASKGITASLAATAHAGGSDAGFGSSQKLRLTANVTLSVVVTGGG